MGGRFIITYAETIDKFTKLMLRGAGQSSKFGRQFIKVFRQGVGEIGWNRGKVIDANIR